MKKIFSLILALSLLTGCGGAQEDIPELDTMEAEAVSLSRSRQNLAAAEMDFYMEKEGTLALYEPEAGCYLGAYILSNKLVEFEIQSFEKQTGKEHSMYSFYTKMGTPFPTDWVLSCIAGMKTPNIVLSPENESYPFATDRLVDTAKKFGEFYVPIFLQFYPDQRQKGYDPEEYVAFFREARDIFRQYASNVAFVWCVSDGDMLDLNAYYPGDEYVDWVGIQIYETIDLDSDTLFEGDVFAKIDNVYYTFQERKPIMITQLGVSHFSSVNHAYYSSEAGEEIKRLYSKISKDYPRIKGVVYMDYNGMDSVNQQSGEDNFTVTDNENVLIYYKEAVSDKHFLSVVDFASGGESFTMLVKSPFAAYKIEDTYYISEASAVYDLQVNVDQPVAGTTIDGGIYYDVQSLGDTKEMDIKIETLANRIIAQVR